MVSLTNAQATADILTYANTDYPQTDLFSPSRSLSSSSDQSNKTLLTISSVFPFDLFPDTVAVEENKVKIIFNHFSFSYRVHGVLIRDITDVLVDIHLFLATLTMVDSSNYQYPIELKVNNLQIPDALRARSIIQELIAAQRPHINNVRIPFRT